MIDVSASGGRIAGWAPHHLCPWRDEPSSLLRTERTWRDMSLSAAENTSVKKDHLTVWILKSHSKLAKTCHSLFSGITHYLKTVKLMQHYIDLSLLFRKMWYFSYFHTTFTGQKAGKGKRQTNAQTLAVTEFKQSRENGKSTKQQEFKTGRKEKLSTIRLNMGEVRSGNDVSGHTWFPAVMYSSCSSGIRRLSQPRWDM